MEYNEGESHDGQNMIGSYIYNVLMRETQDIIICVELTSSRGIVSWS